MIQGMISMFNMNALRECHAASMEYVMSSQCSKGESHGGDIYTSSISSSLEGAAVH